MQFTNPIIPKSQTEVFIENSGVLDYKALCIFMAIGFFLDDDTHWTHKKVLRPGTENSIDDSHQLLKSKPYFHWYYSPRDISFQDALDEFSNLLETIIAEQTANKRVILPLSGGLDSRTQAVALHKNRSEVFSYSYAYQNGFPETRIAKQIASACGFDFEAFTIKNGYLWDKLDELVTLNKFYSDFTNPRQMCIANKFEAMGDVFSLGHWGDVLFDSYNVHSLSDEAQVDFLMSKLLKKGGLELAIRFWDIWDLDGDFKSYFRERIASCLNTIDIDNTDARLRAFKSKYWAPRWTSVNLSIFEKYHPITLPYYDDRMCEFICTIPERYLTGRQLQIEYIKRHNPDLAKITWQNKRPYNLYNYTSPNAFRTWTYKLSNKLKRSIFEIIGKPYVQRNWELQFYGNTNRKHLETELYQNAHNSFIPIDTVEHYLNQFYIGNTVENAHALNMLLVLAKFNQKQNNA